MIDNILKILTEDIRNEIKAYQILNNATELRLRVGQNMYIKLTSNEYIRTNIIIGERHIESILKNISDNSIYTIQDELNLGYVTIEGGHRIGVAGEIVFSNGNIKNVKNISSMNIRIARQIIGSADKIMPYILDNKEKKLRNTLIVSPPGCGKTTVLRDIIRQLSIYGFDVGVVDERGEIASMHKAKTFLDLGPRTDVISYTPKEIGINMLLRSMSPEVIATDEIGSKSDVNAIKQAAQSGVYLLFTMHGSTIEDIRAKENISDLIENGYFDNIIILSNKNGAGTLDRVYTDLSTNRYNSKLLLGRKV